jgi:pimeloyl-ACP methyl ester carboxylesterase
MRLASVLALVVLLTGWQPGMTALYRATNSLIAEPRNEEVSPPPPQNFGPDTYRTHVFTGRRITRPGLTCDSVSTGGQICTGFLPSAVDRALLDVTLMIPPGSGLHPLVALLHGWGGSKGSSGDIAQALLAEEYAVLRYSARGFGHSWGQVNLSDVHVEMEDLRSMIGRIVDRQELQIDPDAIAIAGVSYGGGQSWLALLHPTFRSPRGATVRIRTVVPVVPWSDLLYSLMPNGRPQHSLEPAGSPKLSYVNGLYFSGLRRSPDRPYPNYPLYLIGWHAWINGIEPTNVDPVYRRIINGLAGYRSIWWQQVFSRDVAQNRVPVFQVQGLTDDLFPLPEAKRMLLALRTLDPLYPIASYFGDLGHPRASNKSAEVDYVVGLIQEWLAYYLRGVGSEPAHAIRAAITRPRDHPFSKLDVITVADYDALATRTVTKEFGGSATLINPVSDPYRGFYWDPLVMEAARELKPYPLPPPESVVAEASLAVYTVEVAELTGGSSLLLAGQPTVSLRTFTVAPRVQLNVRLFDVAPDGTRYLVTRGTYILDSEGTADVMIQTYGNVWEAAPDHMLQLEITNLDTPYITPSRIPSVTHISDVRLELPVR